MRVFLAAARADLEAYCAFDVHVDDGQGIRQLSLRLRKVYLTQLLDPMPDAVLRVGHVEREGEWLLQKALGLQLEGIVAKDLASTYQTGVRSRHWFKIKRPGAVPPERFRFGSLIERLLSPPSARVQRPLPRSEGVDAQEA